MRTVLTVMLVLLASGLGEEQNDGSSHTSGERICNILVGPQYPIPVDILEGVEVTLEFSRCKQVQKCLDGSFASGRRCDGTSDCEDTSDEKACSDDGQDVSQVGDKRVTRPDDVKVSSATMALVALMETYPDMIKGKRVLELGSGMGIASLAAMKLGAKLVVATDGAMEAVEHASNTLTVNKKRGDSTFYAHRLRWGNTGDIARASEMAGGRGYDVIIGADLMKFAGTESSSSAEPFTQIATTWNKLAHSQSALLLVTEQWREGLNKALIKELGKLTSADSDATVMDVLDVVKPVIVGDPLLPQAVRN